MMTLAVDTSSKACSCAVMQEELLLAEGYLNTGLTHSATLMKLVSDTMESANLTPAQIERLAVSIGPGSYTGLRIGLAAIKGMAMVNETLVVGVSTLLSLAYNLTAFEGVVCAVLDARVGQVFAALFSVHHGEVTRLCEDGAMTLEALGAMLPEGAMTVGDGAELVYHTLKETKHLRLAPVALRYQRASSVAQAAQLLPAMDASEMTLLYHRLSQAERERAEREAEKKA